MELTCYVIDDQQHCIRLLEYYVTHTPGLTLLGTNQHAVHAMEHLLARDIKPDLTFLDIEMPGMTGLEIAHAIHEFTQIIFTTGKRDYGPQAFEIEATDYLLKPFSIGRFEEAVRKAKLKLLSGPGKTGTPSWENKFLFIPGNGKYEAIRVSTEDIRYIKADANFSDMYLVSGQKYCTYFGLGDLQSCLPADMFYRVHKSYIINIAHIQKVNNDLIFFDEKLQVPISDTYKKAFWDLIAGWRKNKT